MSIASLQIEGNTLTINQVTAILENKRVLAPEKDILEVQNAINVYDRFDKWKATIQSSFLEAHAMLMKGLVTRYGKLRTNAVGIAKGATVTHIAPPANIVKALINELFAYLQKDKDPVLIKSCVFHYELEFIHPFSEEKNSGTSFNSIRFYAAPSSGLILMSFAFPKACISYTPWHI